MDRQCGGKEQEEYWRFRDQNELENSLGSFRKSSGCIWHRRFHFFSFIWYFGDLRYFVSWWAGLGLVAEAAYVCLVILRLFSPSIFSWFWFGRSVTNE